VSNQFRVKLAGAPTQEDVMRKEQPDELGYIPGVGSVDDAAPARTELRLVTEAPTENTHGYDAASITALHDAVDKEDQPSPLDAEVDLFLRRLRMEKAITASEKDRLIVEMASIITRIGEIVTSAPNDKQYGATIFAARMIAKHPNMGLETVCLSTAQFRKTGEWTSILSEADVRDWKP
jgi:hypothetical protein